jgi:hypothetical protein
VALGSHDLVGAVQPYGGQVVLDLGDVHLELLDLLEDQGGQDVRSVFVEPLRVAVGAVVIELLGLKPW